MMLLRCRSLYTCFVGAVFMVSIYNFAVLTLLNERRARMNESNVSILRNSQVIESNPHEKTELELEETMEIEMEGHNNHIFSQNKEEDTLEEMELVQDIPAEPKIFWSTNVEIALSSRGDSLGACESFREKIMRQKVDRIMRAEWDMCGRPNNAFAQLEDGTRFCIRHRYPHNFFIAGESLSYHLARDLGISSVPCTILDAVYPLSRWPINITQLGWRLANDTIALTQWIPSAHKRAQIPQVLLDGLRKNGTLTSIDLEEIPTEEQIELAQWSDVILFDYLTGQYDRIASMQDEADKQNETRLMELPVRNMASKSDGSFWLFDNEGGFLEGYILLYQATPNRNNVRFQRFHDNLLKSLCIFRRSTVQALDHLYQNPDPLSTFLDRVTARDPLLKTLLFHGTHRFRYLKENFNQRLTDLVGHFAHCSDLISTPHSKNIKP